MAARKDSRIQSKPLADHQGKYVVAIQRGAGMVYLTAHRCDTMAAALLAAGSMHPLKWPNSRVLVLRVLGEVKNAIGASTNA